MPAYQNIPDAEPTPDGQIKLGRTGMRVSPGTTSLREGDRVTFDVYKNEKGVIATNIELQEWIGNENKTHLIRGAQDDKAMLLKMRKG
jgi:hypothetical protein